ncbi:RagB/SusD family nutrient uptake outer membrane protein [Arcticibacter tournemirensis]|uniref:RagB/SusD family nutrient uptake outer membrane protein n=1 Tax=Arcticibacter tournemirensis TaxID=699437 RepID=A0A4Q0MBJ0_9SPHI|nr:RagB/SusD family nutrient uptake outer membrane protein [Arcticibacter tournemirensis]RXF70219.1 RagB/SusD family nutrient uptake outer membrane protein [Arcticibacter tournemirensis]
MILRKKCTYAVCLLFLFMGSCTNLDENIYDTLLTDNFYNNRTEVLSAVLRPYTHASAWVTPADQRNWWEASELSADQLAWPTKGVHGEDGGKWKRLHYHTWTNDEEVPNNAWILMYWGMGLCNDPIGNIEKRPLESMGITQTEKDAFIAELKLFRAFHYLRLMDLFGNIPVVTQVGIPQNPPTQSRAEVFKFIETEIKENIDRAPKLSSEMLGRMTQASGYAMLVELYLNAEVWTGTPRWDDCIAAADKLISGQAGGQNGAMALDPNITDQFKTGNHLSKEAIFSIGYNYTGGNFEPKWPSEFYHFQQRFIYGGARNGNNGVVVIPGVYATYDNADLRKSEWLLIGPQYRFDNGEPAIAQGNEYSGQQIVFVDNIRRNKTAIQNGTDPNLLPSTMSDGEENSGVRFNKYKLGNNVAGKNGEAIDPNYNSTDWNVYRLTWIYFAKAEALMRKNGGIATPEAVQLINDCKERAFAAGDWPSRQYTTATLTLNELLAERGREFIFEGYRRQDLVRYGKFTTQVWWDHSASQAHKNLFPIPQQQRSLNPNLTQNEGYF